MKRMIALVLSLVMALSLCAPAWGAENVTEVTDAEELAAALVAGGEILVKNDIDVDANSAINVTGTAVLDLNGNTIAGVSDTTGANKSLIVVGNTGDLTVKNGSVTMEHKGDNMGWNNSTNALEAVSGGKLTLDHVTVTNLGGSDMAYAVNIGNNGGATLKTIASTLESVNYNALRIFNNADGAINVDLTEGSVLTGSGSPFFVHFWTKADLGDKQAARQAYLNLNFNDTEVSRYSGSKSLIRFGFTDAIYYSGTDMTEVVAGSEAAFKWALENGKNVLLNNDITLTEGVTVAAGSTVELDLNGKTVSYTATEAKATCAINNKGTLTIENGTVTYKGVGDPNFGYGTNTINNTGKLTIDGATIINTTDSGSSVAIDCSAGANLIVESGTIESQKNAIRLCPFDAAAINCTINGGTITGARAIQIQLPSNKPESAPEINLTVNDGTLNGTTGLSIYSYSYGQSFANVTVKLNGGIYNNDVAFGGGNAKTTEENVVITGGTYYGELGRYLANDGWEDLAAVTVGSVSYANLQAAVDAVADKGTITVKANDLSAVVKTAKTFTVEYAEGVTKATITAATGYILEQSGNTYTVTKYVAPPVVEDPEVKAEVEVAAPTVDTSDIDTSKMNETEQKVVETLGTKDAVQFDDKANEALASVADTVVKEEVTVKAEDIDKLTEVLDETVTEKDVVVVVQTNFEVKVEEVSVKDGEASIKLDITPVYQKVVTTKDVAEDPTTEIVTKGDEQNAVVVDEGELKVTEPVTITIAIPEALAIDDGNGGYKPLFVTHTKDNGTKYVYEAKVEKDGEVYTATFTNPNGFSKFSISATDNTKVKVDGMNYADLQSAINDLGKNATIEVMQSGLKAEVKGEMSFKVKLADGVTEPTITAANGYNLTKWYFNGVYTYTVTKASAGGYYPSTPATPSKPVQSAGTFDAGIGLYVGMSVMAACGSAVVIGKKKD